MGLDVPKPDSSASGGGVGAPDYEIEKAVQVVLDTYADDGMIVSSAGLAEQIIAALRNRSFLK
jgi:hypothetical protein